MKRIRLLVLAGVLAAALPIGLTTAGATGGSPPPNSVTIQQYADYDAAGLVLDVGLYVRCKGNGTLPTTAWSTCRWSSTRRRRHTRSVSARVLSPSCVTATTHAVGVTVVAVAPGFDAGQAKATATLTPGTGGGAAPAPVVKWITIVVV